MGHVDQTMWPRTARVAPGRICFCSDESKAAGEKLKAMLEMGASRPWPDALEAISGQRQTDASAMAEYFAPLKAWLDQQNAQK